MNLQIRFAPLWSAFLSLSACQIYTEFICFMDKSVELYQLPCLFLFLDFLFFIRTAKLGHVPWWATCCIAPIIHVRRCQVFTLASVNYVVGGSMSQRRNDSDTSASLMNPWAHQVIKTRMRSKHYYQFVSQSIDYDCFEWNLVLIQRLRITKGCQDSPIVSWFNFRIPYDGNGSIWLF